MTTRLKFHIIYVLIEREREKTPLGGANNPLARIGALSRPPLKLEIVMFGYALFNADTNKYVGMSTEGNQFWTHWQNKAFLYDNYDEAAEDAESDNLSIMFVEV